MKRTVLALVLCFYLNSAGAIRCFQCSSSEDADGEDNCGAFTGFDETKHVAVECNSEEANTPGTFCAKLVTQGAVGFIWDGRWRQTVRRCASVTKAGVNNACNWKVQMNGEYIEECYCSRDNCNSAPRSLAASLMLLTVTSLSVRLL